MFDAERLLGGLIGSGISRKSPKTLKRMARGMTRGSGSVLGMGALGVAIAAFDHFTQKGQSAPAMPQSPAPPPPPTPTTGAVPPPPTTGPPPPPMPAASGGPEAQGGESSGEREALLLIQGMIAAANADGHIDDREGDAILGKLYEAGFGEEERRFILQELADPKIIDSLLPQLDTPQLRRQFYAVSCLAIEIDTQAERDYLANLSARLGLDAEVCREIEDRIG